MKTNNNVRIIPLVFLLLSFFAGCGEESEKDIRRKLEIILEDDLQSVINEVPSENIVDSPYYEIVTYKKYDEGKYTHRAEVDFFFLKKLM